MSINSSLVATLAVGLPSISLAAGSYVLATKATHATAMAQQHTVDAEAYERARESYDAALATVREDAAELRAEVSRLRAEIVELRAEIARLTVVNLALRTELANVTTKEPPSLSG